MYTGFGPGDTQSGRERENGKESHKASQSRPPERREIERSDIPSKGRFRRLGFLQPLLVNFLLRLTIIPEERIFPPSSNIWKIGRSGCFSRNEREKERDGGNCERFPQVRRDGRMQLSPR